MVPGLKRTRGPPHIKVTLLPPPDDCCRRCSRFHLGALSFQLPQGIPIATFSPLPERLHFALSHHQFSASIAHCRGGGELGRGGGADVGGGCRQRAVAFAEDGLAGSSLSGPEDCVAGAPLSLLTSSCELPRDAVDPDPGQTAEPLVLKLQVWRKLAIPFICGSPYGRPSPPLHRRPCQD